MAKGKQGIADTAFKIREHLIDLKITESRNNLYVFVNYLDSCRKEIEHLNMDLSLLIHLNKKHGRSANK